jgi:thiol:disulfide interchange protein
MNYFRISSWIVILLCVFTFTACKSKKNAGVSSKKTGIQFTQSETLSDVLDKAAAENKLVFVDFYTTWCLPCKLMDQDVFPDRRLGEFMNENFVSYKVNAEQGNGVNLATLYNIEGFPTLLFLDTAGNVLERKLGAAYQREMYSLGESALASVQ